MESTSNSGSVVARVIPVLIIFFGLLGLYYLYQYLFGGTSTNSYELISKTQPAQLEKPITLVSTQIAKLYEGGEFTITSWMYITNWSYKSTINKHILSIGGSTFDTIRIYLDGNTPKLHVRLHTKDATVVTATGGGSAAATAALTGTAASAPGAGSGDSLEVATRAMVFDNPQTGASPFSDDNHMCDIPQIDMQRWVFVAVSVNGKTVDVYIDGKLSRSCILPNYFKVDSTYQATLLDKGGFGGQISTTMMYDVALNPEQVYRNYMAGPMPITSFTGLLASFLPNLNISISSTTTPVSS